ncbi:MAG: hypothetical protein EOM78_03105, partial [Erysipelotrichia bacterium]|nr:hypothetical protein [Erysipelotrichia bacterium]
MIFFKIDLCVLSRKSGKSEIIKLYHSFEEDKSYAVLKVKFDLIEDKKIVKSFTYDKKVLCKSNNPYG